jgi:hypothetical protein
MFSSVLPETFIDTFSFCLMEIRSNPLCGELTVINAF